MSEEVDYRNLPIIETLDRGFCKSCKNDSHPKYIYEHKPAPHGKNYIKRGWCGGCQKRWTIPSRKSQ